MDRLGGNPLGIRNPVGVRKVPPTLRSQTPVMRL